MIDLDAVENYKVLLVGDGIIDEYNYVTPIGKSIKEPVISTLFEKKEEFRGGIWAAAEHVKSFCKTVDTLIGPHIMVNRRYLTEVYTRKLFTVHEKKEWEVVNWVDLSSYDLVIVADFGHGAVTKNLIERLSQEAQFLCINAQTNSQNYGFNMITKYERADLVVLDEIEARLATHDKDSPLEEVILKLNKPGFKKIIVTRGHLGALGYDGVFTSEAAQTQTVVDTMGAGDAFLSVVSPFAKAGFSMKALLKIGNAAGAVKVGIVGHRQYVTKEALKIALDL